MLAGAAKNLVSLRARPPSGPPATLIVSVQRALRLLEAAASYESGATAKVLARDAGLRLGTAYHLLRTLTYEGYLQRLDGGSYVLAGQVDNLVSRSRLQAALVRVRPALAALRDEARAAAYVALYEEGEIVIREVVDSEAAPRVDLWVGFHEAAHATALGKCVLALLDPAERSDYLARHPLVELTPHTITDLMRLNRSLPIEGSPGLSIDREEYAIGTVCLAAAVGTGSPVGSIAISMPVRRLRELETLAPLVVRTAHRVTRALALTI